MASGVCGLPADCIPAPWPSGLRLTRDQSGRASCNLGFCEGLRAHQDELPGVARLSEGWVTREGKKGGEWLSDAFGSAHGGRWQTMNGCGHEATSWFGAASTRHWANWQAGRQASRRILRLAAGRRVKFGIVPDGGVVSACLRINRADRFQCRHAAFHLCRHVDMQTVIRAGRHTTTIAGRPKECSDAAPQHCVCGNPQET